MTAGGGRLNQDGLSGGFPGGNITKLHLNKPADVWTNVLWTDETRTMFGGDQRENLRPAVKHGGGGVMIGDLDMRRM